MNDEPEKKKPTKLAIGVEGGFDLNDKQFNFEHEYSIYVYPEDKELTFTCTTPPTSINNESASSLLTDTVTKSVLSIINAQSTNYKEELAAQAAAWDGEKRFVSKHSASLLQLPNPPQVPPNPDLWKCELCDIRNNLWLNLTDGKILCGRKNFGKHFFNRHNSVFVDLILSKLIYWITISFINFINSFIRIFKLFVYF